MASLFTPPIPAPSCVRSGTPELTNPGQFGNPSRSIPLSEWGSSSMRSCGTGTRPAWRGRPCGSSNSLVQYDDIVAVDSRTNIIKVVNGRQCRISRNSGKSTSFIESWLGSCGNPPTYNQNLPTCIQRTPPPSPPPPPQNSGWGPLPPGTTVPQGMRKIGIYDPNTNSIPNIASRRAADQYRIAICDSGVDATHPDLKVIGGQTFGSGNPGSVGPTDGCADFDNPLVDCYGVRFISTYTVVAWIDASVKVECMYSSSLHGRCC